MRKISMRIVAIAVTILTYLATTTAASACIWGSYQPKEPKALREE